MMFNNSLVASIKVDNKIMREHNGTIYLPFDQDFSILIKNLNTVKAQVNIKIDGEDILDENSLIISAGQHLNLERWLVGGMKTGPKLKFVEKTDAIRETRDEQALDGIVEITYQFEKIYPTHWYTTWHTTHGSDLIYPPGVRGIPNLSVGSVTHDCVDQALHPSTVSSLHDPITKSAEVEQEVYCAGTIFNDDGITVMGEDVKQEFKLASIGIMEDIKHSITFQLKGNVNQEKITELITVKAKRECIKCNKMNKSSYNYCVNCGSNLKYTK